MCGVRSSCQPGHFFRNLFSRDIRWVGSMRLYRLRKKYVCHSERSEESLCALDLSRREILRFAQNDRVLGFSATCEAVPYKEFRVATLTPKPILDSLLRWFLGSGFADSLRESVLL